jgi:hypothetical protein
MSNPVTISKYGDVGPPDFDLELARPIIIETLVTGIVRNRGRTPSG